MDDHEFTLVVAGDPEGDQSIDLLFAAGCDDATFSAIDGVGYGDFIRTERSLAAAVRSAIDQVESVPGLRVLRVEPDDLVTMREIADRMGRTRESVRLLITGQRGPGGFPAPVSHLKARSRLWRWSEVASWSERRLGNPTDDAAYYVIASINAALALRECSARLAPEEQDLVGSLAV